MLAPITVMIMELIIVVRALSVLFTIIALLHLLKIYHALILFRLANSNTLIA
jgi:hypothetical protein